MMVDIIKKLTLSGWVVSFDENPLGLAASGHRVLGLLISKDGREIGTGLKYDEASDERIEKELIDLLLSATK